MRGEITVRGLRGFVEPARFRLGDGATAFVGPNNAGKSSILRMFYELRPVWQTFSMGENLSMSLWRRNATVPDFLGVKDRTDLFSNTSKAPLQLHFELEPDDVLKIPQKTEVPTRLSMTIGRDGSAACILDVPGRGSVGDFVGEKGSPRVEYRDGVVTRGDVAINITGVLAGLSRLARMMYIPAHRHISNFGAFEPYFDIVTGAGFVKAWKEYATGPNKNKNRVARAVVSDLERNLGIRRLEVTPSADNTTLVVYVDGQPYRIDEMGAGFAEFLCVLGSAAMLEPSYVIIDEPELHLHPSLQLDFLSTIEGYSAEGVVFATHSVGLARVGAKHVYAIVPQPARGATMKPLEAGLSLPEFAGELTFSGYRELGFNRVLLVEGMTEVKTIQQFLRLLHADHRVLLIPLGGGQFINGRCGHELAELKRIGAEVFALVDSERSTEGEPLSPDHAAFVEVCHELGVTVHVLERRAIENYLTGAALQRVVGETCQPLGPYDRLQNRWRKSENWRIAREMTLTDIASTDLVAFLRRVATP